MKRALKRAGLMVGAGAGAAALAGLGYVGTTWARYGKAPLKPPEPVLDRFMPSMRSERFTGPEWLRPRKSPTRRQRRSIFSSPRW